MDITFGPGTIVFLSVAGILGLALAALLLRSACDLCSVEPPPSYLRCVVLTVIVVAILIPIAYGAWLAGSAVVAAVRFAPENGPFVAVPIGLILLAIACTPLFMIAFRVRPRKSATIWLVNVLIDSVVAAVLGMLIVGGWTTIDAVRRLF